VASFTASRLLANKHWVTWCGIMRHATVSDDTVECCRAADFHGSYKTLWCNTEFCRPLKIMGHNDHHAVTIYTCTMLGLRDNILMSDDYSKTQSTTTQNVTWQPIQSINQLSKHFPSYHTICHAGSCRHWQHQQSTKTSTTQPRLRWRR